MTLRFWLARRRPLHLPRPAAGFRQSSVRARRLRPALACPTVHVSHAAGQIQNPIIINRLSAEARGNFVEKLKRTWLQFSQLQNQIVVKA